MTADQTEFNFVEHIGRLADDPEQAINYMIKYSTGIVSGNINKMLFDALQVCKKRP